MRTIPTTVFLVAMWVAPELRGTGNARALVERVLDWAREHGASRVCLSVEPGNDRAARLYEKCGFVETAIRRRFPTSRTRTTASTCYEL